MSARERRKLTVHILKEKLGIKPTNDLIETVRRQTEIRTKILKALREGPKTPPEIAEATGLDASTVFWYLMTMYKHGEVEEFEKTDEGYFRYVLKKKR